MKAPIHSDKHIFQTSLTSVAEGTTVQIKPIISVSHDSGTNPAHVIQGSVIKAVFLEYWMMAESSQPSSTVVTVEKTIGGQDPMTHTQALDLNDYVNKKNVLFITQGLVPDANANPVPFLRQWIKIPKGKQRFGLGDGFAINFTTIDPSANAGTEICGIAIYKAYQ